MSARTGHLQHLQEVKEHTSDELPATLQHHGHNSVFTDEEVGGEGSSHTKVNPDSLGSPRHQGGIDHSTYGKWGEGRSSRLPWDEADKEYRPATSQRYNSTTVRDTRDEPAKGSCTDSIFGL
jgi:hypothetical protein